MEKRIQIDLPIGNEKLINNLDDQSFIMRSLQMGRSHEHVSLPTIFLEEDGITNCENNQANLLKLKNPLLLVLFLVEILV